MYSVLRLVYTHSQKSQLTLQVDWTGFHASKLDLNNAGKVSRVESFLFYTQQ